MRKDEQIIAMYDGQMSAREVYNKLNESGVKVSYHYTANVIKRYKSDNVHTTTDNVHFESDNVHSESDNVYTSTDNICTLLSQIVTKLSQIEARLEALDPCNTRARLSTSPKGNNNINIHTHSLYTEGTSPISEGTYDEGTGTDQSGLGYEDCGMVEIDDADPNQDTYQAEGSEVSYEDNGVEYADIPPTDGITQTPTDTEFTTDDYQVDQVEYADIPPTDGITTATISQAPVNTTSTITKGEYWASWKRFRDSVSTLTPEERDNYYHQYIANLHKLYAGQELADMRTKLHRQYTYLCDQAAKPFIPDETAVITMPETDGTMQWCRDYMMASRQMMALNSHAKAQPKEYGEYYASTIRDYMRTHGHITDDQKAAIDGLITRYLTPDAK